MNSEDESSNLLKQQRLLERLQTRENMGLMIDSGQLLQDSHLVQPGEVDSSDVVKVQEYITSGVPITEKNNRLIDHLLLTGLVAVEIANALRLSNVEKYGKVNRDLVQILGLLHDDGKRATFRWYHNELVGELVAKQVGIKPELLADMPSVRYDLDFMRTIQEEPTDADIDCYIESLSLEKKIITIADILAKPDVTTGGLQPFEDVMKYHYSSRAAIIKKVLDFEEDELKNLRTYASERKISAELIDFTGNVYERLKDWLQQEGIDLLVLQERALLAGNA